MAGHLWVFSNEVDTEATPLTAFTPGDLVRLESARGRVLGVGYVNPASLISARLLSRDVRVAIDREFFAQRLQVALAWRERLGWGPFYRLVFGESDGLPGLVVDRYGDDWVLQVTTAGMERCAPLVIEALEAITRPRSILLRNDTPARALEALPALVTEALGTPPEEACLVEGDCRFRVSLRGGQKTGWFFDQRLNRLRLLPYVNGRTVLDVFSYVGGFGIQAAAHGARHVTLIDGSERALAYARDNADANGVGDRVSLIEGDAFMVLKDLRAERRVFDVIILDPPALIKRRKDREAGAVAYERLNQACLALLAPDGLLISASCSHHLERDTLKRIVQRAAGHAARDLQWVDEGGQGPDHPVHPAIPESAYLKVVTARSY